MNHSAQFSTGSAREAFALFYPLFFSLLSICTMSFCDQYFLSHLSVEAFKGAGIGGAFAVLFYAPCIRLSH